MNFPSNWTRAGIPATAGELFGEGGEGASAWGDAGARREVPFVAFPQLGKFLEGGEFPQILAPKVDRELAGGFVEASVSGVVLVAGGGDELAFGRARSTPGASTRRMARLSGAETGRLSAATASVRDAAIESGAGGRTPCGGARQSSPKRGLGGDPAAAADAARENAVFRSGLVCGRAVDHQLDFPFVGPEGARQVRRRDRFGRSRRHGLKARRQTGIVSSDGSGGGCRREVEDLAGADAEQNLDRRTVREGRGGFGLEAAETVGNAGEPGGAGGHGGLFKSIPTGSIPGHRCAEWRFGERAIRRILVRSVGFRSKFAYNRPYGGHYQPIPDRRRLPPAPGRRRLRLP